MGGKTILNIGDKLGKLTLIEKSKKNNRMGFICKCDCGNITWIRTDSLTKQNKPTRSCGCLAKETLIKPLDFEPGQKFGELEIIKRSDFKKGNDIYWTCKCSCGNIVDIRATSLSRGKAKTCGHSKLETIKKCSEIGLKNKKEKYLRENTDINVLDRIANQNRITKSNTSGVNGVCWDKSRDKWVAQIVFRSRSINLGRFKDKEDAIKARKEAEEKYYIPMINKYKKE